MSVVALLTQIEDAEPVASWAAQFAEASDSTLIIVCWTYAPAADYALLADSEQTEKLAALSDAAQAVLDKIYEQAPEDWSNSPESIEIRSVVHPNATTAVLEEVRREHADLVVAATNDKTGRRGATYASNPLLQQAPCNTVVLYQSPKPRRRFKKILFVATDSPHDRTTTALASRMAKVRKAEVTIATIEDDEGTESIEVGRRELRELLRDAGIDPDEKYNSHVFFADDTFREIVASADRHDLVFVAANNQSMVERLVVGTKRATVAVVKRAPPLRSLSLKRQEWIPRLSPGDYADLVQSLRRGSRSSVDFFVMLGLAAAIATLGLLQDSAAVVIGSMLLAPLMTPMVGAGLALAQANQRLARTSIKTIGAGSLLTLAMSAIVALITPGEELTPQVMARVQPNLLDLLIALFSAMAAAYAMARPSLLGAVAGVAIATALVPPLCSSGIAYAYGSFLHGIGASILFITNLVAIILAAAITFRFMGVTAGRSEKSERLWVYRAVAGLCIVIFVLAIPLERSLQEQIDRGKPKPLGYPLNRDLIDALQKHVEKDPGVMIMLAGRPSAVDVEHDVVIYLATEKPLHRSYKNELVAIVRKFLEDPEAKVEILSIQQAWIETETQEP